MPKKKVDSRIRTLIENGIKSNTRTMLVIVGDRGKDQVVNVHYMLSKLQVKARPSVLWCYNKELGFSTHRKKRMKQIKKLQQRGLYDNEHDDPFQLFVTSTKVRWCYYKETAKVLGQTFGCCVLQDFEAITPNILCRTIETVEGGGLVVLLLRTMSSLKQLYTMTMDVHSRFRTEAHEHVVPRFNERFLLSLGDCRSALVVDDELNVLPLSKYASEIAPLPAVSEASGPAAAEEDDEEDETRGVGLVASEATRAKELSALKATLEDTDVVGALVGLAKTVDQARTLLTCAEVISDKGLSSTVAVTAGRGRGKSAAMGLAVAAALGFGYANIFVTAPHPENLRTFFEFVVRGLKALAFVEHTDFEVVASTNAEFNHAPVRVSIKKSHRQTVQYVQPHDATPAALAQAELLVVDEAAAIPLPLVRRMLGPYLVFLSSTTNGYEGTGRSLALKLVKQLRQQSEAAAVSSSARLLKEVTLEEPIRYAPGDGVEAWLNTLLCLSATEAPPLRRALPSPSDCDLFEADRDALFSYHALAEGFLHKAMALFVSSHYKNSPNDLQMLADAPGHRVFVLLGPVDPESSALPDVLCAIQVCFEGAISAEAARHGLKRGYRASGDLIPWTLSQQFQDDSFPTLSGARVVRIATHPAAQRMGYGARALFLLSSYFQGEIVPLGPLRPEDGPSAKRAKLAEEAETDLLHERLAPRKQLPPLLVALSDRPPERLHWLGVSYGLTQELHEFWRKGGYTPLYVRHTPNDLTAEHTCVMLRPLHASLSVEEREESLAAGVPVPEQGWIKAFASDFARRFSTLLSTSFREFPAALGLGVLDGAMEAAVGDVSPREDGDGGEDDAEEAVTTDLCLPFGALSFEELRFVLTPHDVSRLDAYARSLVDFHMILDLMPSVARLVFLRRLPGVRLSKLQLAVLLAMGLQGKDVDSLGSEIGAPVPQLLAMFNKGVRKISACFRRLEEHRAAREVTEGRALPESRVVKDHKVMQDPELAKYAIKGSEAAWDKAVQKGIVPTSVAVAVAKPAAAAAPSGVGKKPHKKKRSRNE
jgi:N-acetyltransferase 10